MSEIIKEKVNELISDKLAEASRLVSECKNLADEHGLTFESPVHAYGMGGTYYGKGNEDVVESGWQASSQSC